jgi:hypothetical protein
VELIAGGVAAIADFDVYPASARDATRKRCVRKRQRTKRAFTAPERGYDGKTHRLGLPRIVRIGEEIATPRV